MSYLMSNTWDLGPKRNFWYGKNKQTVTLSGVSFSTQNWYNVTIDLQFDRSTLQYQNPHAEMNKENIRKFRGLMQTHGYTGTFEEVGVQQQCQNPLTTFLLLCMPEGKAWITTLQSTVSELVSELFDLLSSAEARTEFLWMISLLDFRKTLKLHTYSLQHVSREASGTAIKKLVGQSPSFTTCRLQLRWSSCKQRYQINPNNTYDFTKLYFTITVMYTKIKCKYWSIKRYLTKIFGRNWSLLI